MYPHLESPQVNYESTNEVYQEDNTSYDNGLPDSMNEYLSQFESQGNSYDNDMERD